MKKCLFQNWRFAIIYFLLCSITEIVKFRKLRLVVLRILMLPTIIGVIASLVYKVLVISTENNWHYFVFTRWRLQEVLLVASGGTAWVVCNVRWHGRHSYTMGDELKTMEGQKMRREPLLGSRHFLAGNSSIVNATSGVTTAHWLTHSDLDPDWSGVWCGGVVYSDHKVQCYKITDTTDGKGGLHLQP